MRQASQARKRKINYLLIHICVRLCELERDLSSYAVLGYMRTVENLSALEDVVWAQVAQARNISASHATVEKYKNLYGRKTVYFRG